MLFPVTTIGFKKHLKTISFVFFLLSVCGSFFGLKANAGYYYFPENGIVKACADGQTTAAAMFPGRGYFLLNTNGNPGNAFPQDVMSGGWSPLLGGSSLCWQRGLSRSSSQGLINSWNNYCVAQSRNYCRYQ